MKKNRLRGQILVVVVVALAVLAVIIPAMVMYIQDEARWSLKQQRNTTAFHLAEAALDRAYSMVTASTQVWANVQAGNIPSSFLFTTTYEDVSGGSYALSISSGPNDDEVVLIGVGRDSSQKEIRAIVAQYSNSLVSNIAILAGEGVNITGNNFAVEWGAIASPESIDTGGKLHPTFWSSGSIDVDANGATPPNCDSPNCHWWHSYDPSVPAVPALRFDEYRLTAQSTPNGPCGAYYTNGDKSLNCTDTSGNTYYITGNVTDINGHITGTIIVLGNFTTGNGNLGGGAKTVSLPRTAWKQYSNDWANYSSSWDSTKPVAFPGKNSSYQSPAAATVDINPVIHGFVYVDGDFQGPTGGGNIDFVSGIIYVKGTVNLNGNSHVKIYYSGDAASQIKTTNVSLTRESWQNRLMSEWPVH